MKERESNLASTSGFAAALVKVEAIDPGKSLTIKEDFLV